MPRIAVIAFVLIEAIGSGSRERSVGLQRGASRSDLRRPPPSSAVHLTETSLISRSLMRAGAKGFEAGWSMVAATVKRCGVISPTRSSAPSDESRELGAADEAHRDDHECDSQRDQQRR